MAVTPCDLNKLNDELIASIKTTASFRDKAFQCFSLDDLEDNIRNTVVPPLAGVAYSHGYTKEQHPNRESTGSNKTNIFVVVFSVIIVVKHREAGSDNGIVKALPLLDEIRKVLLGSRGSNARPWRLVNESALEGEASGTICYGQLWETDTVMVGNHSET